ncbi:unnamed protein product [Discosporangium mesarthrocarpum]
MPFCVESESPIWRSCGGMLRLRLVLIVCVCVGLPATIMLEYLDPTQLGLFRPSASTGHVNLRAGGAAGSVGGYGKPIEGEIDVTPGSVSVPIGREAGPVGGDVNQLHHAQKQGFRTVNASQEWRTCQSYLETELKTIGRSKRPGKNVDAEVSGILPRSGYSWTFAMTKDVNWDWLGLHSWNSSYKFGSARSDEIVSQTGYCKVLMPSVPRSGCTWFRTLFEVATGLPSFSVFELDGGSYKPQYQAYSSDNPCGTSMSEMEGKKVAQEKYPCRNIRPVQGSDPILLKSHYPHHPAMLPTNICAVVLIVRNPLDNYDAWDRYISWSAGRFSEWLTRWSGHITHWMANTAETPLFVMRYEDLIDQPKEILRRLFTSLPVGFPWTEESLDRAVSLYGPKVTFEQGCGKSFKGYSPGELELVRRNHRGLLEHLGYKFFPDDKAGQRGREESLSRPKRPEDLYSLAQQEPSQGWVR